MSVADSPAMCLRWRYSESGATTTFVVRAQRIVSIEQRIAVA
jgi:hypothetical protein